MPEPIGHFTIQGILNSDLKEDAVDAYKQYGPKEYGEDNDIDSDEEPDDENIGDGQK